MPRTLQPEHTPEPSHNEVALLRKGSLDDNELDTSTVNHLMVEDWSVTFNTKGTDIVPEPKTIYISRQHGVSLDCNRP